MNIPNPFSYFYGNTTVNGTVNTDTTYLGSAYETLANCGSYVADSAVNGATYVKDTALGSVTYVKDAAVNGAIYTKDTVVDGTYYVAGGIFSATSYVAYTAVDSLDEVFGVAGGFMAGNLATSTANHLRKGNKDAALKTGGLAAAYTVAAYAVGAHPTLFAVSALAAAAMNASSITVQQKRNAETAETLGSNSIKV